MDASPVSGSGHGFGAQPVEALGLLQHHRRHGARSGAADVAVAEGVADLVADHVVAVVRQREVALGRALSQRRTLIITSAPCRQE